MEEINDGGPAFPAQTDAFPEGHVYCMGDTIKSGGMTLRDYFAGQALSNYGDIEIEQNIKQAAEELNIDQKEYSYVIHYPKLVAKRCYEMADAMLKQRES